mmetsp:Transcript_14712/g.32125  ORF Transcript_14712/g.32125 Transcript_14712/m.32125 type:complete len:560 (-) Transcript_14712:44-1723(-)
MAAAAGLSKGGGQAVGSKVTAKLADLEKTITGEKDTIPWIKTAKADTIFGVTILFNAAFIGIDLEFGAQDGGFAWWSWIIEGIFLLIFSVEITLRIRAQAPNYWRYFDYWGAFDFLITLLGIVDAWVITPYLGFGADAESPLSSLTVLRMLRLVRLIRLIRVLRMFSELVVLVQTIGSSIRAVAWMSLLLGMIMYTGSIVTVLLIGLPYQDDADVRAHFGSIGTALFAHFQIVTLEGWPDVAAAGMKHNRIWALYFVGMIVLTNFALVNLMVGVIVERIIHLSVEQENELASFVAESDQFRSTLQALFNSADMDHSGTVTREEIRKLLDDPRTHEIMSAFSINLHVPKATIHTIMNIEGDGPTTFKDFFDACMRMCGSKSNVHSIFVQHDICECQREISKGMRKLEERASQAPGKVGLLEPRRLMDPETLEDSISALLERMDHFGQTQQTIYAEVHAMREARILQRAAGGGEDIPVPQKKNVPVKTSIEEDTAVLITKAGREMVGFCCMEEPALQPKFVEPLPSTYRPRDPSYRVADGSLGKEVRKGLEVEFHRKRNGR